MPLQDACNHTCFQECLNAILLNSGVVKNQTVEGEERSCGQDHAHTYARCGNGVMMGHVAEVVISYRFLNSFDPIRRCLKMSIPYNFHSKFVFSFGRERVERLLDIFQCCVGQVHNYSMRKPKNKKKVELP
jgi:hypothetical protein